MSPSHRSGPEIRDRTLRLHLAVLSTRTKLLRLDHLLRKYSRDQPRRAGRMAAAGFPRAAGNGRRSEDQSPARRSRDGRRWTGVARF